MTVPLAQSQLRVRIFVDFWNFSLSLRHDDKKFMIDWRPIGPLFTTEAAKLVNPNAQPIFEALHVYGSFDPNKPEDNKLKNWFTGTLDRMPCTHATLVERQQKRAYPKCPHCQTEVSQCMSCGKDMRGTEEKGVDTRIVTDMISLAWAKAYDVAVLVSSDRDFVPVAEFLQTKGIKVVHGAFPHQGIQLSQKCLAHFDIMNLMPQIERK